MSTTRRLRLRPPRHACPWRSAHPSSDGWRGHHHRLSDQSAGQPTVTGVEMTYDYDGIERRLRAMSA